ncbi:MAG: hypothetical protein F4X87_03085 [Chloroflexi bacterium]|nr:hypothetical protein [Chloroflexota bacterium]
MNVIDLEILIPASPEFIWRFMGDLSAIPRWYEDVVSVSFLSTQREGRGTRWRHSSVKGNDIIVEINAWYDTLGYEYRIVDGTTFSENQGRIRLQEVSDGTLVRWTYQYALGGVLGGIRNAMRLKRNTTNQIQDSLRNLHQLILQESGGISTHEAKASMQEAPDVYERSSYEPRHPPAFQEARSDDVASDQDTTLSEHFPLPYDLELDAEPMPTVVETDTKPNPVVLSAGDSLLPEAQAEPALDDTRPVEVESLLAEIPPPALDLPEPEPEPAAAEQTENNTVDESEFLQLETLRPTDDDSSRLSVFEIFGLQKPSEATALPEAIDELTTEGPGSSQRIAPPPSPSGEALLSDVKDGSGSGEKQTATELHDDAGKQTISGWRRSARRRKALLRSHT